MSQVRSRNIGRTDGEQLFVCRYPPEGRTAEYETRPLRAWGFLSGDGFPVMEDHEK
jgi:hypothetical protein